MQSKVDYMTLNAPSPVLGPTYSLAWPTHTLFDRRGAFVGFAMPQAPSGSVQLYEVSTLKLSPRLPPIWRKFDRSHKDALMLRAKICANVAIAIHRVHESGQYCLGDLKPQNILLSSDGRVCVVDLDSLQIIRNGKVIYPAHLFTPEYSPPEAKSHVHGTPVPIQWDLFALAVCLYEILVGVHPYAATARAQGSAADTLQGKIAQHLFVHGPNASLLSSIPPPHALFKKLPVVVQQLFQEAFAMPVRAIARPSAEQWYQVFSQYIANGGFAIGSASNLRTGPVGSPVVRTGPTNTPQQRTGSPLRLPLGRRNRVLAILFLAVGAFSLALFLTNRDRPGERAEAERQVAISPDLDAAAGSRTDVGHPVGSALPVDQMDNATQEQARTEDPAPVHYPDARTAELPAGDIHYYKDNNGDGIGGTESITLPSGNEPPPDFVPSTGDLHDTEKLKVTVLESPGYMTPAKCPGARDPVINIQVVTPSGEPVKNRSVVLGLTTPVSWIASPKPTIEPSGAYSVRTDEAGRVSFRLRPPSDLGGKTQLDFKVAVNGATPRMSVTQSIHIPICPNCQPCGTK